MAKHSILLIEDDEYTRDLYTEVLKNAGYMLTTATDGEDGLQKAIEGTYDLIILDILLPKIDGLSILNQLKTDKKVSSKIVILTNLARDSVIRDAMAAGAHTCLVKTDYNPDQLVAKIKDIIAS